MALRSVIRWYARRDKYVSKSIAVNQCIGEGRFKASGVNPIPGTAKAPFDFGSMRTRDANVRNGPIGQDGPRQCGTRESLVPRTENSG